MALVLLTGLTTIVETVKVIVAVHDEMCHDWRGCHLNPYSQRYNLKACQAFFENKAHGPNVWYCNIFKGTRGQSSAFSVGQGGGGRGSNAFQGYGFGCGRGLGRGHGGYQGREAMGAGPTTADPTTSYTFHRYRSLPILNIAHFAHKVHLTSIFAVAQLYSLPW